jgi:hypothetical protein
MSLAYFPSKSIFAFMKRFTASVLSLGLLSAASGVGAATLDFPDFSDLAAFQLNGTAATISNPANGNALRVTDPIIVNRGLGSFPRRQR